MAKSYSKNEKIGVGVGLLSLLIFVPALTSNISGAVYTDTQAFSTTTVSSLQQILGDPAVDYLSSEAVATFETQDLIEGDGAVAVFGDRLYVHYVGQFKNGDMFDTSTTSAEPFEFVLGQGGVIPGWDVGLVGMKEGGTRRLVVPPAFGYGEAGVSSAEGEEIIPGNATLIFDIMLLKVEHEA